MSGGSFLSSSWYRVAALRPALKSQAKIRRHRFRGKVWYVVEDTASGRFNRFTPATYQLVSLMDGNRSLDHIWELASTQLGDDTPSQDEVIGLLGQLHSADLLNCEVNPDSAELFERFGTQERSRRGNRFKNPFSIRIPLWDPDDFLTRTLPAGRPWMHRVGAVLYVVLLILALILAGINWPELTGNLSDRLLSAQNLLLLSLCFPLVKLLHELGHAYVTKAGGGEVHEMGIMFLVFMPIPYVDASAASGFRNKWYRALVGASGMLIELLLAALAMLVWAAAEPGLVRAVSFNVMVIAGVSAIIFNGNPLLRYDAYYILSDLIEMPNLASRGNQYWRYLFERYLFRMKDSEPPLTTAGERRWLFFYTPAALLYRTFVLIFIVLYVATQWFFIGVVLAIWGLFTMFVMPLGKVLAYLAQISPRAGARARAFSVTAGVLAAFTALLLLVPVPLRIVVEGVVWLPEDAEVRAGTDGFLEQVRVRSGALVSAGDVLVSSDDPALRGELAASSARLRELEARLDAERVEDTVAMQITRDELARALDVHRRLQERVAQLVVSSRINGRFLIERADDMPGRFFAKGERFGHVVQDDEQNRTQIIRIVVSQHDVDLVLSRLQRVDVRLSERLSEVYEARLVRAVPAAQDQSPSPVLTTEGGGNIAADPRDPSGGKTLNRMFQFDLELPAQVPPVRFGGRAYVRLVMQAEPLAAQWYRRLRQMFLERFSV